MGHNDSLLDRIKNRIESGKINIPVCNPAILQIHKTLAEDSEPIYKIEKQIATDQTLAAENLRAANSPFYCGLSPVRTIGNAIVRLGLHPNADLVLSATQEAGILKISELMLAELEVMLEDHIACAA